VGSDAIIPFHRPWRAERETAYVLEALGLARRQGGGPFTRGCHALLQAQLGAPVLLTQSCTSALEFAALLLGIGPGDEVIVPSYTFSSTATAFANRGAKLVFVDVDPATQNIDPRWIAPAVTQRTRAIVAMHYGGIACDMPAIEQIAAAHGAVLIEDAAQAVGARAPDGRALGAMGALGALSFHDTKNVSSGEGGALVIGDATLAARAEIMWEKGTDRSKFIRGEIDKYTWVDLGSSFLPSEITAAMLKAHLEEAPTINAARLAVWNCYHDAFAALEQAGWLHRPFAPPGAMHNAHLYYLVLNDGSARDALRAHLKGAGVETTTHYAPLHQSAAGRRFGRVASPMVSAERAGEQLLRLPLWPGLSEAEVARVIAGVRGFFEGRGSE